MTENGSAAAATVDVTGVDAFKLHIFVGLALSKGEGAADGAASDGNIGIVHHATILATAVDGAHNQRAVGDSHPGILDVTIGGVASINQTEAATEDIAFHREGIGCLQLTQSTAADGDSDSIHRRQLAATIEVALHGAAVHVDKCILCSAVSNIGFVTLTCTEEVAGDDGIALLNSYFGIALDLR